MELRPWFCVIIFKTRTQLKQVMLWTAALSWLLLTMGSPIAAVVLDRNRNLLPINGTHHPATNSTATTIPNDIDTPPTTTTTTTTTKAVFRGEFPLTAQFRSGPRNPVKSYEQWLSRQFLPEGFPVDLQTNVLRFAPENYAYANRFAKENPDMLVMSTWRAASGNPKGLDAEANGDPLGQSVIEFPGHFVISPGTFLETDILSPISTTFQVRDSGKMRRGPALLVETNGSGTKLWERFEYVLIMHVSGNTVTVERAFNGSPDARTFPKATTYVAPMPWDFRVHAEYTDWFFNLSKDCPRDAQGRTAMDVIFQQMIQPLKKGGPLEFIGGLDLASGPLVLKPTNADYDTDGIEDSPSVYRDGVRKFYQRVWKVLGESRVLTTELDYEMIGFINGLNQEGLARPNDPWKEVSRTVNEVLAWKTMSELPMVSLAFVQYLNREEDLKRVQMHRLLNGYASCLGLAADVDRGSALEALERDELFKGADKEPHWLGKSIGPLVRPAAMMPNLLIKNSSSTSSNDWGNMLPNLDILRADLLVQGNELVIRPNGKGSGFVTFKLNFELDRKTDVTVLMEAISDDDNVVRHIKLPRISVPVETGAVRAVISNVDYVPIGYLLRRAHAGSVLFDMRFEHGGDIRVRSLSVHAATDTLACQFERGVVVVNPSLDDVDLNLEELFPGRTGYQRLTASNVPKGIIPDKYLPQYTQAMQLNSGELITHPESVKVLERNALFLIADPSTLPISSSSPTALATSSPTESPTFTHLPTASVSLNPTELPTFSASPSESSTFSNSPTDTPSSSPAHFICEDDPKKFELKRGVFVGCWYVQRLPEKTQRRCVESSHQGPFVSHFCPKSCRTCPGDESPRPTLPPTVQDPAQPPIGTCQDTIERFELTKGTFVQCAWALAIKKKTRRRCSETTFEGSKVSNICPKACGKCGNSVRGPVCQDSAESFTLESGASVRCVWTTAQWWANSKRCSERTKEGIVVSNICRSSCGSC